ncbi:MULTISPECIES: GyrI-like domain-containing protein [unclassified Sphingobacterium]|uniref:GyrI-like domain-containing protein n=1 Tax=unclassified Sphingobacterium TaxID=2609468 RepID=UPI002600F602|nr:MULTISPECIES: GyrI-like domain-containing protein [unclassified Sphingobacterium]
MNIPNKYKEYFSANEKPEVVQIGKANYVSILGEGSPGTTIFYKKKAAIKEFVAVLEEHYAAIDLAFSSNVVEIFYWFEEEEVGYVDIGNFYTTVDLDLLKYRIAIRIPDFVKAEAIQESGQKSNLPFAKDFEYFTYKAGTCVQLLHKGPFAGELQTLPILQKFATENGFKKSGMHHEIHLTHFELGQSQEHLQTILRDPVIEQH